MRIAHFIHRYPPALGGSEAYFARLSRSLADQGDEVTVFTSNALDLEAFWSPRGKVLDAGVANEQGVEVRRYAIRHWPGRRYLLKAASLVPVRNWQCLTLPCNPIMPSMWRACGEEANFDVVHASAFPYAFPIACGLRLARRLRIPFVLTPFLHLGDPHDERDRARRNYLSPPLRYLLRAADAIFVQTGVERSALVNLGFPEERLILQGMGVDVAECTGGDRRRGRQRWGLDDNAVVIGHLANKSVEKGTVDLLSAAAALWRDGQRFNMLLAGPAMPNFVSFWEGYPFKDQVRNLGPLSEEEKRDFYAAIDVFAMPSRSDSFGIVFLEAWANGVPCVGYRAGGVAEVIRHESDGILVPCGDLAALGQGLRRLVQDGNLRRQWGETGRQKVHADYQWPPRLELVRQVYERLSATAETPRS